MKVRIYTINAFKIKSKGCGGVGVDKRAKVRRGREQGHRDKQGV
jgi:hypothetical protein